MGDMAVPGIKAYIRNTFNKACEQYGFDKEQILNDSLSLTPVSFFTKIKNGISPYENSDIIENNNDNVDSQCWSEEQGYQCCKECNIVLVEENGNKWGVENGKWCGIQENVCKNQTDFCQSNSEYDCCETCNQYYNDYTGRYGYEKGNWCILKNSC
ncbi:Non-catalytic module family DOC2 [Piromyces sp. E2]|nr:Non-catalytic module family DOC2 [Piromyces sp. E2]|eukprot:OUM60838.1 Non-catalytic module family DOC2 [Piromyces sp. E2]